MDLSITHSASVEMTIEFKVTAVICRVLAWPDKKYNVPFFPRSPLFYLAFQPLNGYLRRRRITIFKELFSAPGELAEFADFILNHC